MHADWLISGYVGRIWCHCQ